MFHTRTMVKVAVTVAALVVPLAACGDDEPGNASAPTTAAATTAAPTTVESAAETVEEFGVRIDAQCPGEDPGFDPFYAEHPTPTAADYVAFLPAPIEMMNRMITCIEASNPPTEIEGDIANVIDAMEVVKADIEAALVAAKAGDLDEVNSIIGDMHDNDAPAIDAAVAAIGLPSEG